MSGSNEVGRSGWMTGNSDVTRLGKGCRQTTRDLLCHTQSQFPSRFVVGSWFGWVMRNALVLMPIATAQDSSGNSAHQYIAL